MFMIELAALIVVAYAVIHLFILIGIALAEDRTTVVYEHKPAVQKETVSPVALKGTPWPEHFKPQETSEPKTAVRYLKSE